MERVEGARTPYEVYCFRCRVTFPIGSRHCLHCGGPLFGAGERADASDLAPGPARPIPPATDTDEGGLTVRGIASLAGWVVVAAAALLQSLCQRGPG